MALTLFFFCFECSVKYWNINFISGFGCKHFMFAFAFCFRNHSKEIFFISEYEIQGAAKKTRGNHNKFNLISIIIKSNYYSICRSLLTRPKRNVEYYVESNVHAYISFALLVTDSIQCFRYAVKCEMWNREKITK